MTSESNTWDVAISFASADEGLALQLRDALQPPHSIFVYSKAQEHLAGRDGVEAFRTVFRERASLIVILYAVPWGDTPWTRVEKTAIEEFALAEGWEHLLFVRLKGDEPVPKWVPNPHLYLNLATFSFQDLVGAIKLRLAELGVETKILTPGERAAAQARRRQFDAETIESLRKVPNDFDSAANELCDAVREVAESVAKESGWRVGVGPGAVVGGFVVTAQNRTIQMISGRKYTNSVDDTFLELREFDVEITVAQPGQRYTSWGKPPEAAKTRRMPIRRLPELGWCWEIDGRIQPIENAAVAIVNILLDRIDQDSSRSRQGSDHYESTRYESDHYDLDQDSIDPEGEV